MATVWLILTNPYAYDKGIQVVKQQAQELNATVKLVYLIDLEAVTDTVRNLGDEGWLGSGALRNLEASMLEGYRALASDVIENASAELSQAGLLVETDVKEATPEQYVARLLEQVADSRLIMSGSQLTAAKLGELAERVQWVEE